MKQSTSILIKTVLLISIFAITVFGSMMMLSSAQTGDPEPIDRFSSPEIGRADTPIPQESLEQRFGKYTAVTEENGKRVATVFDAETVEDIQARKDDGEWFYLTTEEMLYLIKDSAELFRVYDVVRICDADGTMHAYHGMPFYSSEEYLACFGGFEFGINDISFDMKTDLFDFALMRVSMLNSAVYDGYLDGSDEGCATIVLGDLKTAPNAEDQHVLEFGLNPWSKYDGDKLRPESALKHCGVWIFDTPFIRFRSDCAELSIGFDPSNAPTLYPQNFVFETIGHVKYDQNGKVIVAEVYETESRKMIARVRFDSENDPEIIARAADLQEQVFAHAAMDDTKFATGDYYVMLYLNGFTSDTAVMHPRYAYFADGDLSQFDLYEEGLFASQNDPLTDGSAFASFMNEVIKERLEQ